MLLSVPADEPLGCASEVLHGPHDQARQRHVRDDQDEHTRQQQIEPKQSTQRARCLRIERSRPQRERASVALQRARGGSTRGLSDARVSAVDVDHREPDDVRPPQQALECLLLVEPVLGGQHRHGQRFGGGQRAARALHVLGLVRNLHHDHAQCGERQQEGRAECQEDLGPESKPVAVLPWLDWLHRGVRQPGIGTRRCEKQPNSKAKDSARELNRAITVLA